MQKGWINEVFTSIQGEGIFAGRRQTFIRFAGCNQRCAYCDTPQSRVMKGKFYHGKRKYSNPVDINFLTGLIENKEISLTGGEPLLQPDFLLKLLRRLKRESVNIYLETNGTVTKPLPRLLPYIDCISLDFKIPSATGQKPCWDRHELALKFCCKKRCFVKITVDKNFKESELKKVIQIMKRVDSDIPLVIQPVWPTPIEIFFSFQEKALKYLNDVRIIPQIHKLLGIK